MLTKEVIKANSVLATLTEEQVNAITTLSENDESAVIAKKTAEWATQIEQDVLSATGITKNQGEKYYDYLKRAAQDLKTKAEQAGDTTELDKLRKEKTELEEKLKENAGDAALKGQLEKVQKELDDERLRVKTLQGQVDTSKTEYEKKIGELNGQFLGLEVRNEFDKALQGKKPKPGISEDIYREIIQNRIDGLLKEVKPEWENTTSGQRILRFRDQDGNLMNNPANLQKPFSAEELVINRLSDIIDVGKKAEGGGTKPDGSGGSGGGVVSINGATTQVQATELIKQDLMSKGITTSNPKYQDEFNQAWKDNEVENLPLQ